MNILRLYKKLVLVSLRSQWQYRASFFMLTLAYCLGTVADLLGAVMIFHRFHSLGSWTLPAWAVLYGIVHMGFSLSETLGRGLDTFDEMVSYGEFDRVLLRPISPLLQVAVREVQLMRLGRFLQGFCALTWGFQKLSYSLFSLSTLLIFFSIIGLMFLFLGLNILQATCCFWTTESLELFHVATYGGVEAAQYPMSLYRPFFRHLFTFLIPLSCVAYYPLAILQGHEHYSLMVAFCLPMTAFFFFILSLKCFQRGISHYHCA